MNLLCAAVALHMKEPSSCFVVFKELMQCCRLRDFYIDQFVLLNHELEELFHRELRILNEPLYDFLVELGVDHLMFLQNYLTLFACIVDIQLMVVPILRSTS
jgi:hypothetical protein